MKLSSAIDGYLLFKSTRASAETISVERILFMQFLRWRNDCAIGDVTPNDIRRYLAFHRERGLSPHTIRRHRAAISALFVWLSSPDIALTDNNPVSTVPAPKLPKLQPKSLSNKQIESLLKATDASRTPRRNRALLLFLLDTGARASEVANVNLDNLDPGTGRVKVFGKGSKERYVYLGRRALSALWLYIHNERPEPAQANCRRIFLTQDSYPMTRHTVRQIIYGLAKRAGIHASPHQFRHTAAIEHLRHGMDLLSVQRLLGHEDIAVTRRYLIALNDQDVERQAHRSSPSDNWRL